MPAIATTETEVLDRFRRWGYLQARLDPLDRLPPSGHPELDVDEPEGPEAERAREIYCGSIGVEFMHIPRPEIRSWVAERMEAEPGESADPHRVFELLLRGETFEQILQSRYLGNKRFSIEGVAALLPVLDEILRGAMERGAEQSVLAMSHRGRLSAMVTIVGKDSKSIFAGFEDVDPRSVLGGGDVKYHLGATGDYEIDGSSIHIHLASNPSHLEAVDPVVMGRVRAKQLRKGADGHVKVVPIMVHGDSAFAGQGILAETLNLADLRGYEVGGTIHIVANNLIGFTTEPRDYTSARFATDVAKRLPIPIFHVNGEDPDAAVRVARMAHDFRATFETDVVIDLIGFRRHGHSEVDDPTITQPLLYELIEEVPPLWMSYAEFSDIPEDEVEELHERVRREYSEAQEEGAEFDKKPSLATLPDYWDPYVGGYYHLDMEVDTGLSVERIEELGEAMSRAPEDFNLHDKQARLLEQRREMARGERDFDFGSAEALAFASLLIEGTPVRLTGQDSRRGTFNQRHGVLIDVESGEEHFPLAELAGDDAFFELYDSPLSEAAIVGYEYGFSRDYPEALTIWEAQFGDFANGAQVPIDQFVVAGEDKWNLLSGLVMLLPHGYEGQGPEHSSARLERFLQLAAEDNIQVCQPSTAAQYFHLLRRQALRRWRKPLVVMTPKSLLRHKQANSPREDLSRPRFRELIVDQPAGDVERVLFCSGKIGHELVAERDERRIDGVAVVFLEQLYPFPKIHTREVMERYREVRELIWVQEEPANQGALSFVVPRLEQVSGGRHVRGVKRTESASPATGSAKAHQLEQKTLLELAFATYG